MHGSIRRRTAIALGTSSAIHFAAVVAAAWTWIPAESPQVEMARGKAMVLILAMTNSPAVNTTLATIEMPETAEPLPQRPSPLADELERPQSTQPLTANLMGQILVPSEVTFSAADNQRSTHAESPPQVQEPLPTTRPRIRRSWADDFEAATVINKIAVQDSGAKFDMPPKKLPENQPPTYPVEEQQAGHQGIVTLLVKVRSDGIVESVTVEASSGLSRLDAAAIAAVEKWRFAPAQLRGRMVQSEVLVPVRFSIKATAF